MGRTCPYPCRCRQRMPMEEVNHTQRNHHNHFWRKGVSSFSEVWDEEEQLTGTRRSRRPCTLGGMEPE